MSKASRKWKADYISGNAEVDFTSILEGTEWHKPYQAPARKELSSRKYRQWKRELDQRKKIFHKNKLGVYQSYARKRHERGSKLPRFFER